MAQREDDPRIVAKTAAMIVGGLEDRLAELTPSIQQAVVSRLFELQADRQLLELLADTVERNIDTFFSAIRHGIPIDRVEPPTAALEYARRLAQHGVSANALVRSYRFGQQALLNVVHDEVRSANLDAQLSLDVFQQITTTSFRYIDRISRRVLTTYQDEHDRLLENRNSMRALRVREVLDAVAGTEIDVDALTTAIRYPLRRVHLAVVAWCAGPGNGDEIATMERFIGELAESAGSSESPLFLTVDRMTAWAWIPLGADAASSAVARIRKFAQARKETPFVAVGEPLPGVDGFRRSHSQACDARAVAIACGSRVLSAGDRGVLAAALIGANLAAARTWVGEVLGPLASATDGDERLRETLQVFLRTGSSFKAAAEELHLHSNSVKYRVGRAVARRGRPITDDRLDVEIALLVCHRFGAAVLTPG
jgi:DNA-binding PucR family transcriptional regulator